MVLTNTANPIVVLLSSGIDSVVYAPGNLFLLTNYCSESIRAGDIIVFRIQGRGLFIFHRVIRVHEKENGYVKFLTKGDFNYVDDRGLYAPGQVWLEKKDVVGKIHSICWHVDHHNGRTPSTGLSCFDSGGILCIKEL
ncbi:unnamed protein product [Adineta steineri]|uniref:Signal peptidase complex catalytic subunit SEC11 n=1 Tax=Adineta steineri TaxID=433720 RepID=A0A818SZL5_9BILA|nr:unnamed protein product [Adineta steineri]